MVPASEIAYAAWFFLLYSTIQYPGMLGIFRGTLEAYQRYDKAGLIGFIQTQVIDNIMRIVCILLGRWLGSLNPAIGEVMGATMGAIIGTYLREFITAYIAALWCRPILKQIDPTYSVRNLFYIEFTWADVKKCLSFGIRALAPGLISPLAEFGIVLMYVRWLPSYSSLLGLFMTGEMLSHMVCTFSFSGLGASLSESYNNGKYRLTRFYIEQAYKWLGTFGWFMIGLLFYGASLIGLIIGENWQGVTLIIQTLIFFKITYMFGSHLSGYLNGVGHPEYNILVEAIKQGTRLITLWFFLVVIPMGLMSLVYSLGCSYVALWLSSHLIFHFKIMKIRINLWQTFIAPLGAAFTMAGCIRLGLIYIIPLFQVWFGMLIGVIVMMMFFIAVGPLFIFFPMYALLGGWDTPSLAILKRSVAMSGPSKFYIQAMYWVSNGIAKRSPLTNRFPIPDDGVNQEIQELTDLRKANLGSSTS